MLEYLVRCAAELATVWMATWVQDTPAVREEAERAYQKAGNPPQPRSKALLAEQIMSSPVQFLVPGTSLHEALVFIQSNRFRHVPVVDDQRIVGLISDRDVLREIALSSAQETDYRHKPIREDRQARC